MIQAIRLKEFRKHGDLSLTFDPKWNLIYGRNNAGKSTLFYAIEYCFFGNVKGFKKIAQLARYGSNILGVELHFRGKDGNLYKLQRLHTLKSRSRSATGSYTLKQILESVDPIKNESKIKSEVYILSSDFGNREEELTLKLGELTGISKRFFESGIAFHQGSISEILNGSKKLDIVFGITAASALYDLFKSLARDYKKECAQLPNLTQLLDQILQEKKRRKNQYDLTISKKSNIEEKIEARNEQYLKIIEFKEMVEKFIEANNIYREFISKLEKDQIKKNATEQNLADLVKKGGSLQQNEEIINNKSKLLDQIKSKIEKNDHEIVRIRASIRNCEKSQVELESTLKIRKETKSELNSLEKNHGKLDQLIQYAKKIENDIQLYTHEKENNESQYEKIQQNIRNWEQEKGNLSGIISRRKKTNETPRCEYCGAIIDKSKIKEEIIQSKKQLSELNQLIITSEKEISTLKSRKDEIVKKEEIIREDLNSNKQNIDKIRNLEKKIDNFPKLSIIKADLTKFETEIKDLEVNIKRLEQNLSNLRENEKEVHTNNS